MANFEQGDNFGGSANTSSTAAAERMGAEVYAPEGQGLQFDPNKVPDQDGGAKPAGKLENATPSGGDDGELRQFSEEEELLPGEQKGELKDLDGTKGPINEGKAEGNGNMDDGDPSQRQLEQKKLVPDENGNYPNDEGAEEDGGIKGEMLRQLKKEQAVEDENRLRQKKKELAYCPGAPKAKIMDDAIMFDAL